MSAKRNSTPIKRLWGSKRFLSCKIYFIKERSMEHSPCLLFQLLRFTTTQGGIHLISPLRFQHISQYFISRYLCNAGQHLPQITQIPTHNMNANCGRGLLSKASMRGTPPPNAKALLTTECVATEAVCAGPLCTNIWFFQNFRADYYFHLVHLLSYVFNYLKSDSLQRQKNRAHSMSCSC